MAGHGSPPAEDKANHPGRQVTGRDAYDPHPADLLGGMDQRTLGPVQGRHHYAYHRRSWSELSPEHFGALVANSAEWWIVVR